LYLEPSGVCANRASKLPDGDHVVVGGVVLPELLILDVSVTTPSGDVMPCDADSALDVEPAAPVLLELPTPKFL